MSSPPRKRGKATAQTPPTPPTARAAPNLAKRAASLLPPPNASATRQRREKAGVPAQRLGQGDGFGGVRARDWDSTTRDAAAPQKTPSRRQRRPPNRPRSMASVS